MTYEPTIIEMIIATIIGLSVVGAGVFVMYLIDKYDDMKRRSELAKDKVNNGGLSIFNSEDWPRNIPPRRVRARRMAELGMLRAVSSEMIDKGLREGWERISRNRL